MSDKENTYFAAREAKKTADVVLKKARDWTNDWESNGLLEKLRRMYAAYHGAFYSSQGGAHQIKFTGEQGELVQIPINHIRNLGQHMLVMTTSNRPALEARSINTDYKSLSETMLANGILDYYMREKRLEKYLKKAVEQSIALGAGFIKLEWNATSGEVIDMLEETNTPIYEGDIEFSNPSVFDVVYDGTKESDDHDWVIVRGWKNRFDLAAKYPEFANKILQLPTKSDQNRFRVGFNKPHEQTDDIEIIEFYHRRTDSLPNGRYMFFLTEEIVLQDTALPYRVLPVFRISPGDFLGTPYGYSTLFDILPIQEAINSLYSAALTNLNAHAVQNLWIKPGSNINISNLEGGMDIIESAEKPEALDLVETSEHVYKFMQILEQVMETISGINSVTRGNSDSLGSNPSGTAMALVQSMALQFMSGLQQSYVQLMEDVGIGVIKILQDYASSPRLISIVGKSNKTYMKEFTSEDIGNITRVVVDVANPMSKTTAGKVQMASELVQYSDITPDQYLNVVNFGKLEIATENSTHRTLSVREENEALIDNKPVIAMLTDKHSLHILEHASILSDPDLRFDAQLVMRVTKHIQEHIDLLKYTDPALLQILGEQPIPPPMPAGEPPEGAPQQTQPEGQVGLQQENGEISGPGLEQPVNIPSIPKVDASLLPNPELQQQALGNVSQ